MAHLLEWEVFMPEQIEKEREGRAQDWGGEFILPYTNLWVLALTF